VVRRAERAARASHDPQHVHMLVARCQRAEAKQLLAGRRREPLPDIAVRTSGVALAALEAGECVTKIPLEHEQIALAGLYAHQQAVERRDVDPDRVEAAFERLHERRARPGERVEDATVDGNVPAEELLDELRDVLAEVRVQAVDVLRSLPLRQIALRPRQVEVEPRVDLLLGHPHLLSWFHRDRGDSCSFAPFPPSCGDPGSGDSRAAARRRRLSGTGRRTRRTFDAAHPEGGAEAGRGAA
jgi:hypothetical protein